jgi:hypothetical protein
MTSQIIILTSSTQPDNSFAVLGVFWLTAPSNAVIPLPAFKSQVPNIAIVDLASLRAGTIVEQSFNSGLFPSGTTLVTVQTTLQTQYTAAQTALNNINPPLAGLIGSTYNGVSWAAPASSPPALPISNYSNTIITDTEYAIAFGYLPNMVANRVTGYVTTGAANGVVIRATAYTPQGTNAQRSLKSTSASDTAAGVGARTIIINYLNTSFQLKQDTVTLNGITAVNTNATDIAFIESMVVATVGTQGGGNVGAIQIFTATAGGGSLCGSIAAGDNTTFWAQHYVPTGVTCYLLDISGGSTAVSGRVTINRSGNPLTVTLPQVGVGGTYPHLLSGSEDHTFTIPIAIPGPDFVWLVETPNASTASTAFGTLSFLQF